MKEETGLHYLAQKKTCPFALVLIVQAPVVQTLDSAIHRINNYF